MLLKAGMVLLSDTRTNAGLDNIATYRKMFTFEESGERCIVILTAGSLSVTQTTLAQLRDGIEHPETEDTPSIMQANTMLEVAEIVGNTLASVRQDIDAKMQASKVSTAASMIVAGQRKGGTMRMFLIYPEGNFIESTEDTPYLQIGEHKYGKPILDRVVSPDTSLEDARKAVFLSMDSTLRSNLSVGMPLDFAVIEKDACRVTRSERIEAENESFRAMSQAWSNALRDGFQKIEI
nr:peptidase [Rhodobacter sp. NTK016B]